MDPLLTEIRSQEQERGKRGKKKMSSPFFGGGECYGLLLVNMTAPNKEERKNYVI